MPKPRKAQLSLDATPYYHCVAAASATHFFALDICAQAVMSNHYHVVLHVDREQAKDWTDVEVIEHWHQLFASHPLTHRLLAGDTLLKVEHKLVVGAGCPVVLASDGYQLVYALPK